MHARLTAISSLLAVMLLAACGSTAPPATAQQTEVNATNRNQGALRAAYPIPSLQRSEELENLIRRLEMLNTETMTGCITLVSYGTVMGQFVVDGKVTSLNTYLTAAEQYVDVDTRTGVNAAYNLAPIEMPDLDGAYGQNADGIFFFDTAGGYHEWKGEYYFSNLCSPLSVQPVLTYAVVDQTNAPGAPPAAP